MAASPETRLAPLEMRARLKLQEYRSKEILARHGLPLLAGETATTPEEARAAAERIGGLSPPPQYLPQALQPLLAAGRAQLGHCCVPSRLCPLAARCASSHARISVAPGLPQELLNLSPHASSTATAPLRSAPGMPCVALMTSHAAVSCCFLPDRARSLLRVPMTLNFIIQMYFYTNVLKYIFSINLYSISLNTLYLCIYMSTIIQLSICIYV